MRTVMMGWAMLLPAMIGLAACASSPGLRGPAAQEQSQQVELGVSRIPRVVDTDDPDQNTPWPVTIVTGDELRSTGSVDLGQALRRSRAGPFVR